MKYDIELTLEWLDNLEQAVGLETLLDCMPNGWGGRVALRALLAGPSRDKYYYWRGVLAGCLTWGIATALDLHSLSFLSGVVLSFVVMMAYRRRMRNV